MTILREELITNHLLLDYFDMWEEFDIQKVDDPKTIRYYNLLENHIQNQIDASIRWLESDEARDYFFGEAEYQRDVFRALEDEWDEILSAKYPSVEALLAEVYRRGKAKGYTDMREHIKYTDADKQAIKIARNYNYHLIRRIDNDTRTQIKNKITEAVIAGEHPYTVAPKILNIAEEKLQGSNFTPRQRATMIARTEISRVQNTGILQSYVNEGYTEVKILTAGDSKVCNLCLRYAFEFEEDVEIIYENHGEERTHNIIKLVKGGNFPPFHPICRCTYLSVWNSKGEPYDYVIDLRPKGFKSSMIPSIFIADNTYIEELDKDLIKQQFEDFQYYTENKPYEYCEIYDAEGNRIGDMLIGDDGSIPISWEELRELVHNGAFISIHNHPLDFDNLHSVEDLITQLKAGLKYSIVESYTKRYIVVNTNNELNDDNQLIKNLRNFQRDFEGMIDDIVDPIVNQREIEHFNAVGEYFTPQEFEDVTVEEITKAVKEHFQEYETELSKFFNSGTGLKLYVHDK